MSQPVEAGKSAGADLTPPRSQETFYDLGIGRAASILLGVAAATHLFSTVSDWHTYRVVHGYLGGAPDVEDANLNSADFFARLTSIPNVAVSVAAAVVFVLWLWRARLNSEVFCQADHRRSHLWVLTGWICPGVNLVYPKQIVDDIWVASDPKTPAMTDDLTKRRAAPVTSAWWFCWVAAMILDVGVRRVLMWIEPTVGSLRLTALAATVSLGLTVASAVLALSIIKQVTAMQTTRPWVAWWDAEHGRQAESAEPTHRGREPMATEPTPVRPRPAHAAPAHATPAEPAYAPAAQAPSVLAAALRLVPDLTPSAPPAREPRWSETVRPSLVGLPAASPADPDAEETPTWSPFTSMVEEWRGDGEPAAEPSRAGLGLESTPAPPPTWPAPPSSLPSWASGESLDAAPIQPSRYEPAAATYPYPSAPYEPAPYEPAPYEPAPYQQPAPYQPAPYQPAPYEPAPYQPAAYDPAPYHPAPYEPATYEPAIVHPATSEPSPYYQPSDPAPYQPSEPSPYYQPAPVPAAAPYQPSAPAPRHAPAAHAAPAQPLGQDLEPSADFLAPSRPVPAPSLPAWAAGPSTPSPDEPSSHSPIPSPPNPPLTLVTPPLPADPSLPSVPPPGPVSDSGYRPLEPTRSFVSVEPAESQPPTAEDRPAQRLPAHRRRWASPGSF